MVYCSSVVLRAVVKASTLACCIDYINQTMERHIITLEDPIEFEFKPKRSFDSSKAIRCRY